MVPDFFVQAFEIVQFIYTMNSYVKLYLFNKDYY